MPKIGVLTTRSELSYSFMHTIYDFEDCIVKATGAELIQIPRKKQDFFSKCGYKLKLGGFRLKDNYDVLFCLSLDQNTPLEDVVNWRERCKTCICYVFDTWPNEVRKTHLRSMSTTLQKVDLLCFSLWGAIDHFKEMFKTAPLWVPQAVNPERFYYVPGIEREIPIYIFGRQPKGVAETVKSYCLERNIFLAHHYKLRFPGEAIMDWQDGYTLHAQLLLHSKITLNWAMHATDPWRLISPLTNRWIESAAAGCLVVGVKPKDSDFDKFLPFPGFVRNVNEDFSNLIPVIEEAIHAKGTEDLRRQLADYTKNHHTWYHRIAQMLNRAKLADLLKPQYRKYLEQEYF